MSRAAPHLHDRFGATIAPEEQPAAALVSLVLYTLAGITLAATAHLTRAADRHDGVLTMLALLVISAGPVVYRLQRDPRTPSWLLHVLQSFALLMVAIVVGLSGAARSPYWFYIFFPALFCSYFYRQRVGAFYLGVCVVIHALPFVYADGLSHPLFVTQFVCAAPAYVALGLAIGAGKVVISRLRARAETLAREQGALRRVATAVADGSPAHDIYRLVASELAALLGCEGAGILRRQDDAMIVVGAYGSHEGSVYREGTAVPITAGSDVQRALDTGTTVRIDRHPAGAPVTRIGYVATVLAPVTVGSRIWGLLAIASTRVAAFDAQDEQTVMEFGTLLATAIASAEERTKLAEQALTDPLTGLANSRALHDRLRAELARSSRHGAPLSVAVIDVDHFKDVNDNAGHEAGDQMLVRVAAALSSFARSEDTLGRLGGDEFAWILPGTTREQALVAVERARRMIAQAPADPLRITISAGICDTDSIADPTQLIELADRALYWSKAHGRNQIWIYDPAVVQELTDRERAQRLERVHALEGLRSLVRSIEQEDPGIRGHSERVAALAARLARAHGFCREDERRVRDAAMLHALGRLAGDGVAVPEPASGAASWTALREQAQISARMARSLLDAEQVAWIGDQYRGEPLEAPDGADLITLADLWDTLTEVRRQAPEEALGACARLPVSTAALAVLAQLHRAGELAAGEVVGGDPL